MVTHLSPQYPERGGHKLINLGDRVFQICLEGKRSQPTETHQNLSKKMGFTKRTHAIFPVCLCGNWPIDGKVLLVGFSGGQDIQWFAIVLLRMP
jgi:hypothetical protein